MGVAIPDIGRLDEAESSGATEAEFDALVTDSMVDAIFIAGAPGDCVERMVEVRNTARSQGFSQLMFSELGPDVDEAMTLLCDDIVPAAGIVRPTPLLVTNGPKCVRMNPSVGGLPVHLGRAGAATFTESLKKLRPILWNRPTQCGTI